MKLRLGEYLAGTAAIVATVSLFVLEFSSEPTTPTGWDALSVLRWFVLVSAAFGLGLVAAQGLRSGPGLAVTLDLVGMLVSGVTTILLAIKLAGTGLPLSVGAYVDVVAVAGIALGAFRALRVEQGWTPGPDRPVAVVPLHSRP